MIHHKDLVPADVPESNHRLWQFIRNRTITIAGNRRLKIYGTYDVLPGKESIPRTGYSLRIRKRHRVWVSDPAGIVCIWHIFYGKTRKHECIRNRHAGILSFIGNGGTPVPVKDRKAILLQPVYSGGKIIKGHLMLSCSCFYISATRYNWQ